MPRDFCVTRYVIEPQTYHFDDALADAVRVAKTWGDDGVVAVVYRLGSIDDLPVAVVIEDKLFLLKPVSAQAADAQEA